MSRKIRFVGLWCGSFSESHDDVMEQLIVDYCDQYNSAMLKGLWWKKSLGVSVWEQIIGRRRQRVKAIKGRANSCTHFLPLKAADPIKERRCSDMEVTWLQWKYLRWRSYKDTCGWKLPSLVNQYCGTRTKEHSSNRTLGDRRNQRASSGV